MKKIILFSILSLVLFSCKKDRTCSCTVTKTGTSTTNGHFEVTVIPGFPVTQDSSFVSQINDVQSVDKKLEKVTKQTAKNNCVSYTEPYNETTLTSVPGTTVSISITVTDVGNKRYSCKLK